MCAALHSTHPSSAKGSRCGQSWASPHLDLWASYGNDFRVHSWVGIHPPQAYVEKKSLLLVPRLLRGHLLLSVLVCFVMVLSSVQAACWNQLFLFSWMPAEPPLSCCCGGHGSLVWKRILSCKAVIVTIPD